MEGHYQEPANQLDSLLSSQNFRLAVLGDSVQTQSSAPHENPGKKVAQQINELLMPRLIGFRTPS